MFNSSIAIDIGFSVQDYPRIKDKEQVNPEGLLSAKQINN